MLQCSKALIIYLRNFTIQGQGVSFQLFNLTFNVGQSMFWTGVQTIIKLNLMLSVCLRGKLQNDQSGRYTAAVTPTFCFLRLKIILCATANRILYASYTVFTQQQCQLANQLLTDFVFRKIYTFSSKQKEVCFKHKLFITFLFFCSFFIQRMSNLVSRMFFEHQVALRDNLLRVLQLVQNVIFDIKEGTELMLQYL